MNHVNAINDTNQPDHNGRTQTESVEDALRRLAAATKSSNELDTDRVIAMTLLQIQKALSDLDDRVAQLHGELQPRAIRKEWYSIAEAAAHLGKAEFTVREWCRLDRINAHKRESGRGGKREWMISQAELDRIRDKGLLPFDL